MHSDEILSLTVYQLFLRAFTKEGTLSAAARHLSEIKDLGVDIVYVCPFMVEDEGEDRAFWSIRQKDSGLDNPKNPYRISDRDLRRGEWRIPNVLGFGVMGLHYIV